MSKKIMKSIVIIGIVIATILILTTISNAASLSISTSKSSVSPGEVFTVTVTLNGGAGPVSASASNGSGSGSQWLENSSLSFSCTAGSSGTVTISASGTVGDFATETDVYVSSSKNVTIVQPTPDPEPKPPANNGGGTTTPKPPVNNNSNNNNNNTTTVKKSNNSKLSSLKIAEGIISPEFSNSVEEYSISVPNETTKLSISAVADSSKATVRIRGNEDLQVGENDIEIIVTAEDGSKTTYKLLATRADKVLNLQSLSIYFIDENGKRVDLKLDPTFSMDTYEYNILEKLSHTVKDLKIEAIATKENAKIEITGNEELKAGKNAITIKVTLTGEAGLEEQKTYKITLEKEEEPVIVPLSTMDKIKNWFGMAGTTVSTWISENFEKITTGMLVVATVAFVGLTIYFAYDYKNYQKLLAKLAEYNKESLMERANVALDPEIAENNKEQNMEKMETVENIEIVNETQEINENEEENEIVKAKTGKGKRFK